MNNKPLTVAVLGLGLMGQRMLAALSSHQDFCVVKGFDTDLKRCQLLAKHFGFEAVVAAEELFQDPDVDLLYIATPPASHLGYVEQAVAGGKRVLVEKPLAVDVEAAEVLIAKLEDAGIVPGQVCMNFPLATLPGLPRMQMELEDGTAGSAQRVEIILQFSQWPRTWHRAGNWLRGGAEGGFLREVFSHFAYITGRLLTPLKLVHADVNWTTFEGVLSEQSVQAVFDCDGVPVHLSAGVAGGAPDFNSWTLYCKKKSYRIEDWSKVKIADGQQWSDLIPEAGEHAGLDSQLSAWRNQATGGPAVLPSLRDGLNIMHAVESIHKA